MSAKVGVLCAALIGSVLLGCQSVPTERSMIDLSEWEQATPDERERACDLMRERLAQLRAGERAGQLRGKSTVCTQGGCFSRPGPLLDEPFGRDAEEMNRLAAAIEEYCE